MKKSKFFEAILLSYVLTSIEIINGFKPYYYDISRYNEIFDKIETHQIMPWSGAQRDFVFNDINNDGIKDFIGLFKNIYSKLDFEGKSENGEIINFL